MKAFGTPVKIAALEFHSVFCERRCCVNVEQGQDAGGPVCPLVGGGGSGLDLGGGGLEVRAPGTVPESYL